MRDLLNRALEARENAYAPYSDYRVGAALLTEDGRIFVGSNMENASYGATLCAERSAFASAISSGVRKFKAIAIAGGKEKAEESVHPCGICRQVMAEFCSEDFKIIYGNEETLKECTLAQLLPLSFRLED